MYLKRRKISALLLQLLFSGLEAKAGKPSKLLNCVCNKSFTAWPPTARFQNHYRVTCISGTFLSTI